MAKLALKCPHCSGNEFHEMEGDNPFIVVDKAIFSGSGKIDHDKHKALMLRPVICNACNYVLLFRDPIP